MVKVSAYHSINPSDPDVYHDHSDCPTGQQIPAHNRRPGTNELPPVRAAHGQGLTTTQTWPSVLLACD